MALARPGPPGQSAAMRATAILTVKNEGAFLLEWLAHHRACGFTHVLAFSNACSDGTDAMLDRLAQLGGLTHVRNDGPHDQGPHWSALRLAEGHPALADADWLAVLDVDEFVNIHAGDRTLAALVAALPQADAIAMTWRMFGNCGVVSRNDRPVLETFLRAAPATLAWPWRAQQFKTLYRNDGSWRKPGIHRPRGAVAGRSPRWFDGSGRAVPDLARGSRSFSDYGRDNYGLVQLNHYALGSMQDYLLKCDRGRANREAAGFDMGYWIDRNFCAVEDRSIMALDSTALRADLMADPVLGALHRQAENWRKARFQTLMQDESQRALFGRLLMSGPTRVLDKDMAKLILSHAARAEIPMKQP